MTTETDTSHLDPARDRALAEPRPGVEAYGENYLMVSYEPTADMGLWLHLGTWPEDFGLWEDIVLMALPGDEGLIWTRGYHRTPRELRPAGPNLRFECIEPFRHWRISFDGVCTRTPYDEMLSGLVPEGPREKVAFELDARCVTPIWDAHDSATSGRGGGSMEDQVWASEHYQQLLKITGRVDLRGGSYEFDTTGVRDHSRGQRGQSGGMDRWGGHTLIHVLFGSGRAVGVQRMWMPDGTVTLDTAYVLVDGRIYHADVLELPQLDAVRLRGDKLRLVLQSDLGEHHFDGEMLHTTYTTPLGLGLSVGADVDGPYGVFGFGHARWSWEGEEAYGLTERSNRLPPG
jgi:hypothetical protein